MATKVVYFAGFKSKRHYDFLELLFDLPSLFQDLANRRATPESV